MAEDPAAAAEAKALEAMSEEQREAYLLAKKLAEDPAAAAEAAALEAMTPEQRDAYLLAKKLQEDPAAAAEAAALEKMTEEQRAAYLLAKKMAEDPAAVAEAAALEQMTDEQKKAYFLAKKLKEDPQAAAREAAYAQMTPEQRAAAEAAEAAAKDPFGAAVGWMPISKESKGSLFAAKSMFDNPSQIGGFIKNSVPDEYKGLVDQAEAGLSLAAELQAKKVEMQLMAITKVVEQIMTSDLTKDECVETVKGILAKMGHEDKFQPMAFDMLFSQIDTEGTNMFTQRQMAELINLMVFGGV